MHLIEVLFDYGAKHSTMSTRLVEILLLLSVFRHSLLSIAIPHGKVLSCWELFIHFHIHIHRHNLLANLYKFELTELDIILWKN